MKKFYIKKSVFMMIAASLLVGCGGSTSTGNGSSSNSAGGGSSSGNSGGVPNVYGYQLIVIHNNLNKTARDKLMDSYVAGTVKRETHRDVHCTDYQFSKSDLYASFTDRGIKQKEYIAENDICYEYDYTKVMNGNYTVVLANKGFN